MKCFKEYLDYLKDKGIPLTDLNSKSNEVALEYNDAIKVLDFFKNEQIVILGGDILSKDKKGKLGYIIHLWGYDYHYLNWYCDKLISETELEYKRRTYEVALNAINMAHKIAILLKKECFICFVI